MKKFAFIALMMGVSLTSNAQGLDEVYDRLVVHYQHNINAIRNSRRHIMRRQSMDEQINPRVTSPVVQNGMLSLNIDGEPFDVSVPHEEILAYERGHLSLNTLANRVLFYFDKGMQNPEFRAEYERRKHQSMEHIEAMAQQDRIQQDIVQQQNLQKAIAERPQVEKSDNSDELACIPTLPSKPTTCDKKKNNEVTTTAPRTSSETQTASTSGGSDGGGFGGLLLIGGILYALSHCSSSKDGKQKKKKSSSWFSSSSNKRKEPTYADWYTWNQSHGSGNVL